MALRAPHRFSLLHALALATAFFGGARTACAEAPATPQALVAEAIAAMGGREALAQLHSVRLQAHSYRNALEQSERPQGPWIPEFTRLDQWADLATERLSTASSDDPWAPDMTLTVADGMVVRTIDGPSPRHAAGRRSELAEAQARLALGPERVLQTALAAADLQRAPDVRLQDVPQQVLLFHWHDAQVKVFLNAYTHLPTAVERVGTHPFDVFWNVWGEVRTCTWYSFWSLQAGGLRYPLQWDVWRNGQPWQTVSIDKLELNPAAPALPVPTADERAAFRAQRPVDELPLGNAAEELAPGVIVLHGAWNAAVIRQDDGLVVIEAPISTGYSGRVLDEAARRFPGVPVKAVVSTSDAWPHLGGVRTVVARGLPLYAHALTLPILRRVLEAPHTAQPDALAREPRAPRFHPVDAATAIGSGANRLVLYPVHGEAGERMLVAYLPQQRLLYASDLVQPKRDGGFAFPEYLTEVAAVVARERLAVDRVTAMHTAHVLPWTAIEAAIAATVQAPAAR